MAGTLLSSGHIIPEIFNFNLLLIKTFIMKKFIIKAMLFTFLLAITTSGIGQTVNTRPGAASDFESNFLIQQNQNVKPNSYMTDLALEDALQAGGDRLVNLQNNDKVVDCPKN